MRGGILTLARTGRARTTSRGRRGWDGLRLADCRLGGSLQALAPAGIASLAAVGLGVQLGAALSPAAIASLELSGYAVVTPGAVAVVPAGIASAEALGPTTIPSTFLPTDVSGLILWLNADVGTYSDTGLTTPQSSNGGSVKGWADQSGGSHNATQATGCTLATSAVNGKSALSFASQYLVTGSITVPTTNFTWFVVWEPGDAGSFSGITTRGNGNPGSLYSNSGVSLREWDGGSHSSQSLYSSSAFSISCVKRSGTTLTMFRNGTADSGNPFSTSGTMSTPEAIGIGADANGGEGGTKKIAMVLYYDNAVSSGDQISIHSYLGNYYGVTMGGS